jgi:hypothetical protein
MTYSNLASELPCFCQHCEAWWHACRKDMCVPGSKAAVAWCHATQMNAPSGPQVHFCRWHPIHCWLLHVQKSLNIVKVFTTSILSYTTHTLTSRIDYNLMLNSPQPLATTWFIVVNSEDLSLYCDKLPLIEVTQGRQGSLGFSFEGL